MANPLIGTTSKTSYLYAGLVVIFALVFCYLWFFDDPSAKEQFDEHAFTMSAESLKNSIYLANLKFVSRPNSNSFIDIWTENDQGLDFNQKGYPIGINLLNFIGNQPINKPQCEEVWNFFMSPLQPIKQIGDKSGFIAEIDTKGRCSYLNLSINDKRIIYNPTNGNVAVENNP